MKDIPEETILILINAATLPAATEKFVARENFVINRSKNAKVKISCLDDNFRVWFLDQIEDAQPERILRRHKLLKPAANSPIIAELGGEVVTVTTLQDIWHRLEAQPNGEAGDLLINGYANIFYVRGLNGTLFAVDVYWRGRGWVVGASSVRSHRGWHAGRQVFSR